MNRFSLYVLLILVFLSLSKWFAPSEKQTPYLVDESTLSQIFPQGPVSVLLIENFQAGLLFKTYYLKLKVVEPFGFPETIVVRTHELFWSKIQEYKGMSIFRKEGQKAEEEAVFESHIPLPPGVLYVGNPSYGSWIGPETQDRIWKFHRPYRNFPDFFHWGKFRPSFTFYKTTQTHQKNKQPFFGLYNEFGKNGVVTQSQIPSNPEILKKENIDLREHIKKFILIPPWKI